MLDAHGVPAARCASHLKAGSGSTAEQYTTGSKGIGRHGKGVELEQNSNLFSWNLERNILWAECLLPRF